MPRFFHGGDYPPPTEIRDGSFDMLRDHGYPRHARAFKRELQAEVDGDYPPMAQPQFLGPTTVMMPGSMSYTRFVDPGLGSPPASYGASGRSAVEAMRQRAERTQVVYNAAGVPVALVTPADAAYEMGGNDIPRGVDPEIYEEPLPRGVLPADRMQLTTADLSALEAAESRRAFESEVAVVSKRDQAMASAQAARAAIEQLVQNDERLPWWQR